MNGDFMSSELFNLVFSGELVKGAQLDAVKANLVKMFKLAPAQIEKMFSGNAITLKKNIDAETGRKLRAKFKQAGIACRLEPFSATAQAANSTNLVREQALDKAPQKTQQQSQTSQINQAASQSGNVATFAAPAKASSKQQEAVAVNTGQPAANEIQSEAQQASQSVLSLAPVGADVLEGYHPPEPPPPPNVDAITIAPVGADVLEEKQEVKAVEVDISGISLADDQ